MKIIIQTLLLMALTIFVMASCRTQRNSARDLVWLKSEAFQQWCRFTFHRDSGMVSSAQNSFLQHLLVSNDTSFFAAEYNQMILDDSTYAGKNFGRLDTFQRDSFGGKYFRGKVLAGSVQWVLCCPFNISGFGGDPFVFEITESNGKFNLTSWNAFYHGNYACCWHEPMDGFYKMGTWFFVNTCGTGSGFCSNTANLLFFPLSAPSDTLEKPKAIPVSFFQQFQQRELLEGKFQVRHDTIIGEYTYKLDSLRFSEEEKIIYFPMQKEAFQVLLKVDTVQRCIIMLNRKQIMDVKPGIWMFESEKY
jgi:hypothetical protein